MKLNEIFQIKKRKKKKKKKVNDRILRVISFYGISREGWRMRRPLTYDMIYEKIQNKTILQGISLVFQWLKIHLPVQRT